MSSRKHVAVVGGTGYTGVELVRLLLTHPDVEIAAVTSESRAGEAFSAAHPQFEGIFDLEMRSFSPEIGDEVDLVFLALPHGVSMDYVAKLADKDVAIVDLSGDFRLSSAEIYEEWYGKKHTHLEGFDRSAYGLVELYRDRIAASRLVANPGCYPTASILATYPLIATSSVDPDFVLVDAKSGVTGAGAKLRATSHYAYVNENCFAYGIAGHRHTIEIQENLRQGADGNVTVQFTPHLLPVDRGIIATAYLKNSKDLSKDEVVDAYKTFYADDFFVRVRSAPPTIKDVRGTNFCDVYPEVDSRTGMIIVVSVIDNLLKGASGQAVQNMNVMLGFEEAAGLKQFPMKP